jgi:hydroxyacylglutathione hydrolase
MVEQLHFNENLKVIKIVSDTFDSNVYLVDYLNHLLIIDPGEKNSLNTIKWLLDNNKKPDYCLITHEHFDHNIGYLELRNNFYFKTICSEETKDALKDSKKSLSFYYNLSKECEVQNYTDNIPNYIKIFKTPGHSEGSQCFLIENLLFSGDTIIDEKFLVTKLPGGNKKKLTESIKIIERLSKKIKNLIILPGHGEVFKFNY